MKGQKRQVILITDGDKRARRAVEKVASRVGGRCISLSAGNPTPWTGVELADMILTAEHDPVLVMVDDRGEHGAGAGERALHHLMDHPDLDVLGVIAVASNTTGTEGIAVDFSIDRKGNLIKGPVNKEGRPEAAGHRFLEGDTVETLGSKRMPLIVGVGDIGKMDGADEPGKGSPVTLKAVEEILRRGAHGRD